MNNVWNALSKDSLRDIADAYRGKNLLLTGGRGYLGAALTQALTELDCGLILLDRSSQAAWQPGSNRARVSFLNGDVSQDETWDTALEGIDYAFHLAGLEYRHRESYDAQRDLEVTVLSVMHMLDGIRRKGLAPKIVYSSSANLFGRASTQPVNEDTPDDPLTSWAVHKLTAERYLRLAALEHGIGSITLRLANVYGPTPRRERMSHVVLNRTISRALSQQPLTLYANRNCLRDFLYIDDAVRAMLLAGAANAEGFNGGYYVVGSGQRSTIDETWTRIGEQVRNHTGADVPVRFDQSVSISISEMRDFVADATRFQRMTGWKPQVDLQQGIGLTIDAMTRVAEVPASV